MRIHSFVSNRSKSSRPIVSLVVSLTACFLSAAQAKPTTPDVAAPVELRGYFQYADELSFSLRIPKQQKSFWIELGQWRNGVEAIAFDAENVRLHVEIDGHTYELRMAEAQERTRADLAVFTLDEAASGGLSLAENTRRPPRPDLTVLADTRVAKLALRGNSLAHSKADSHARGIHRPTKTSVALNDEDENLSAAGSPDVLELIQGSETTHLAAKSNGAYQGRYIVRTPRRDLSQETN